MITWLLVATCAYTAINLIVGLWKTRTDSYETFVAYRKSASLPLVLLSVNATFVGGGMFFATGQMGYEAGYVPLILPVSTALGLICFSLVSNHIRSLCDKAGALTLYEYIEIRLCAQRPWSTLYLFAYISITLILYFFLLAGQFLVLSTFLQSFGDVTKQWALIASVVIVFINTVVYGVVGGLKKDMLTDAFQMVMVAIGSLFILYGLISHNGILVIRRAALIDGSPQYGMLFVIGSLLFFSPSFLVRYDLWQRALSAKSNRTMVTASLLSIPIVFAAYGLFIACGIFARSLDAAPSAQQMAVVTTLKYVLSSGGFIFATLALYAAVMSSADTFLNISSISLYGIICRLRKESEAKPQRSLLAVRLSALGICTCAVILVLISPDIVDLMIGAFSSLVIAAPSMAYIILSSKPSARGALISISSGLVVFLVLFFGVAGMQKTGFTIATIIALLSLGLERLVSRMSRSVVNKR